MTHQSKLQQRSRARKVCRYIPKVLIYAIVVDMFDEYEVTTIYIHIFIYTAKTYMYIYVCIVT